MLKNVESLVREEDFMIYKTAELRDIAVLLKQESRMASSAPRFVLYYLYVIGLVTLKDFIKNPLIDILKWTQPNPLFLIFKMHH